MEETESKPASRKAIIAVVIVVIIVVASVGGCIILSEEPEDPYEGINWSTVNSTLPSFVQDNISTGPVIIGVVVDQTEGDVFSYGIQTCFELREVYGSQIVTIPLSIYINSHLEYSIYLVEEPDIDWDENYTDIPVDDIYLLLNNTQYSFIYDYIIFTKSNINDETLYFYGNDNNFTETQRVVDCVLGIFNGTVEPRLANG
jgi:hypothetical protein